MGRRCWSAGDRLVPYPVDDPLIDKDRVADAIRRHAHAVGDVLHGRAHDVHAKNHAPGVGPPRVTHGSMGIAVRLGGIFRFTPQIFA